LDANLPEKTEIVIRMKPVIKRPELLGLMKAQEKNVNQKQATAILNAVSIEYFRDPI
jgi:hypothetical protein